MERTRKSVDAYLASIQDERGDDIRRLDQAIVERMPGAQRHLYEGKFWGGSDQQIVGYGMMDYENRSGDNVEWFVVGLAAQKNYTSMYVNAAKDGRYLLRDYEKRLGKAKVGSASVSFGNLDDVDFDVLMELVEEAGRLA